jgi:hypothetical protein
MAGGYSYKTVEKALMAVFDARQGALRGRLKRIQTLGLPGGGPGKGQRASYSYEQVCDWLLTLEFEGFGFPPVTAVQMVNQWNRRFSGLIPQARQKRHGDIILVIKPSFISEGAPILDVESFTLSSFKAPGGTKDFLEFITIPRVRVCLFNLSSRLEQLDEALNAAQGGA